VTSISARRLGEECLAEPFSAWLPFPRSCPFQASSVKSSLSPVANFIPQLTPGARQRETEGRREALRERVRERGEKRREVGRWGLGGEVGDRKRGRDGERESSPPPRSRLAPAHARTRIREHAQSTRTSARTRTHTHTLTHAQTPARAFTRTHTYTRSRRVLPSCPWVLDKEPLAHICSVRAMDAALT
jgi:hypothetical protein